MTTQNDKPNQPEMDASDILATLRITKIERRTYCGGAWAIGTIAGHRFEALVFPEHAEIASYELDDSRISKLHLRRLADRAEVACFDRGWDCPPKTDIAKQLVDLLAAGLAELVWTIEPQGRPFTLTAVDVKKAK